MHNLLLPLGLAPKAPAPANVPWCDYPATQPAANCISWLAGRVKRRADCAECLFCKSEEDSSNG